MAIWKIELISAFYGEDGNPKRQMDVRKVIQKKLDGMLYDFSERIHILQRCSLLTCLSVTLRELEEFFKLCLMT